MHPALPYVYATLSAAILLLLAHYAAEKVLHEPAEYPGNRYYEFDYRLSRTANWTVSTPRRHAYAALAYVTTGRIDEMRQPSFAEWPQLLLAVALTGVLLVVTWILG